MTRSEEFKSKADDQFIGSGFVDISDLIYYIGHHDHLTGIQRVQASLVQEFIKSDLYDLNFIAFNVETESFHVVPKDLLKSILFNLTLPQADRLSLFKNEDAKIGSLPGSLPVDCFEQAKNKNHFILLIGAAWVINDYFRHINALKITYNAHFACVVHDLIPIYARETCDQGTANVFRHFLSISRLSTDLFICVSENTRRDLLRYFDENGWQPPHTAVIRHASELPRAQSVSAPDWFSSDPTGFALFVSTIEGRKNHRLMFNIWKRLVSESHERTPKLLCIGRPGWRAEDFLLQYTETSGLKGKIELRSNVSDSELGFLYQQCLFTVYPSLYEGWGLPISESFSYGKPCICSNTSSMPEAGQDLATYINPNDFKSAFAVVKSFIEDRENVRKAESRIRQGFKPRSWASVATEYLAALSNMTYSEMIGTSPHVPGHFVFRSSKRDFDGTLGEALLDRVVEHLRSELKPGPIRRTNFENGHLARAGGDWKPTEEWGTWIGMGGATIAFVAEEEAECIAYICYNVLPPFFNERVKITANGTLSMHQATYNGSFGIFVVQFTCRLGRNVIAFSASSSEEQRMESFKIDRRGLMLGLREMAIIYKDDIEARLDLLQTISHV